jgi:MFS family permease
MAMFQFIQTSTLIL